MENRIVKAAECYGYEQIMSDLEKLIQAYPFVRLEYIGESVLGRAIPAVRIGSGDSRVHVNASIHANEWITGLLLMYFLEDYARAIHHGDFLCNHTGAELSETTTLYAVPIANPDGVDLVLSGLDARHPLHSELLLWNQGNEDFSNWKANIRGVDLNDQFPAYWEEERIRRSSSSPGPRDYSGPAPLSEPEAAALAAYTRRHEFDMVIALHTQGREIYWNYRHMEPPVSERIVRLLSEASGYLAVKLAGSDAGYKDWFIQEFRRPGFTVEAGFGVNPLPIAMFASLYQEVLPILEIALSQHAVHQES